MENLRRGGFPATSECCACCSVSGKLFVIHRSVVNVVSQTMNKHISPYGHVALPSKKKCAVTSNYCIRSWRLPSDILLQV